MSIFLGLGNTQTRIDQLDALSRTRALTDAESIMLERLLWRVEKKSRRAPYGENKLLAREGYGRNSRLRMAENYQQGKPSANRFGDTGGTGA